MLGITDTAGNDTGRNYTVDRETGDVSVDGANLYTIQLASGAPTLVGTIGDGTIPITALAVAPQFVKLASAMTATFTDEDGDLVTVKVSQGVLGEDNFRLATKSGGSLQLRTLNLAADGNEFSKASVTITATPQGGKGNSFTDVGRIDAFGVDLANVSVNGDLGGITVGDADTTKTSPGLASLTVQSMGMLDRDNGSGIQGPLGKLTIKTTLYHATVAVNGGSSPGNGTIGAVSIGGDIIGAPDGSHGGGITATGNIASISILGSIVGGGGTSSGHVTAGGTLGRVFVGGNIVGSNSFFAEFGADSVESVGNMGSVVVGGSILGGKSSGTGSIHSNGKIASVTVRGDLIGGDTFFGLPYSGAIFAQGTDEGIRSIGRVAVGGSLVGGTGSFGGSIYGEDGIASATIMGSARGGSGLDSGSIVAGGKIGVVTVGGDLAGGMGANSGSVYLFNPALLSSVTVRGSVIGGSAGHTGIMSLGTIGTIRVLGSVRAESAAAPVHLSALGTIDPTTAAQAIAIRSVSISQSVTHAVIDVGYFSGTATNPDAQIGTVIVGGNWNGSSIVASVVANNGIFGDADDTALADSTPDLIVSRITAITIKGSAQGTLGGADGFGFVAQQVGSLKVGAATYPLTSGPSNDLAPIIVGTTGDLRVREV